MSGTTKLSQDMTKLINNRQDSDVQFEVGGGTSSTLQENGENIYDLSATVTLYAHSCILRCRSQYFDTLLDEEKNWKSSKGVIYMPNISPGTFQDVLHYIYTGNVPAKTSENIVELIAIANEIDLIELSVKCQNEFIRTIKNIFFGKDDISDDKTEGIGETLESIPMDVVIRTHVIPAMNLTNSHSLRHLSQILLTVMLPNIFILTKSPAAYNVFIKNISSEALIKIISSDNLAMTEHNVWDLALTWACHQTDLSKAAVAARLASLENDNTSEAVINGTQLDQLKKTLEPLLPAIRFSLFDPNDYALIADTLNYLLPRRRYSELNQHFINTNCKHKLDNPRIRNPVKELSSKIIIEYITWHFLRKTVFETGGIIGCSSSKDLDFDLLFRASEHGFLAKTFHERCDNKGPTLTLVRSADGHLFGGVNFAHWKSDNSYSSSPMNFLFTLPDGNHRKNTLIFKNTIASQSSYNNVNYGPTFGGHGYDLCIASSDNSSHSELPHSYNGSGASKTALAGANNFIVSDYEVFAISKRGCAIHTKTYMYIYLCFIFLHWLIL